MLQRVRLCFGALAAVSLMAGSTVAAGFPAAPVPQPNPWGVLSIMSGGAPAAAVCGATAAAAAAAQSLNGCVLPVLDAPPEAAPLPRPPSPPISVPAAAFGAGINPLLLGLLAVATGVGLYFAVRHGNSPT